MSNLLRLRVRAFGLLIQLIPLLALALEAYWRRSYTGLHRLFVESRIRLSGHFNETFDGLLALLTALVLGYVILFTLAACRLFGKLDDDSSSIMDASRLYGIIPITVGLAVMGWGLYLIYWGSKPGNETRVDVAAVEAGRDLESRRVVMRGRLLADEAISLSKQGSGSHEVFVPLVSSNWTPGHPIAVALKITALDRELVESSDWFREPAFEGMISPSGLPGPIRVRFEGKGLTPGEHLFVLDFRARHDWVMIEGGIVLIMGLVLTSIFFALRLPLLRRNRLKPTSAVQETMTLGDKALPPVVGWSIFGGFMLLVLICLIYARLSGQ